ncbi:MAG: CpcT/CpeT family chromophore lyase [Myxococcota bacterium]
MSRAASLLGFVALLACGDDASPMDATDLGATDLGDAGAPDLGSDAGAADDFERLGSWLRGDFDNQAQFDRGFPQLVERHVCQAPGFDDGEDVMWVYVEHVEHVPAGRDAYFIRMNEIRREGEGAVSRAYRFPEGHPLRTNAFTFSGSRDACFMASLFGDVTAAELDYRAGCDVTYTPEGETFRAESPEETCTFPGGWIQTLSTVYEDGLDSRDRAVTAEGESGSTFEFRRVEGFTPPAP